MFWQNGNDDDDDDDIEDSPDSFDSFKIVKRKGKKHFCKCKRGPMGHPGAPGIEGKINIFYESVILNTNWQNKVFLERYIKNTISKSEEL